MMPDCELDKIKLGAEQYDIAAFVKYRREEHGDWEAADLIEQLWLENRLTKSQLMDAQQRIEELTAAVLPEDVARWINLLSDFDRAYGKDKRYGELAGLIERLARENVMLDQEQMNRDDLIERLKSELREINQMGEDAYEPLAVVLSDAIAALSPMLPEEAEQKKGPPKRA